MSFFVLAFVLHYCTVTGFANETTHFQHDPRASQLSLQSSTLRIFNELIERKGDSGNQEDRIFSVSLAYQFYSNNILSAVLDTTGRYKIMSWSVDESGAIHHSGDSGWNGYRYTDLDIAVAGRDIVIAVLDSRRESSVLLVSYVTQRAEKTRIIRCGGSGIRAGRASMVKIIHMAGSTYVTAVRTIQGALKLITWRLNTDCSFKRLADSGNVTGAVHEISMSRLDNSWRRHIVTSV